MSPQAFLFLNLHTFPEIPSSISTGHSEKSVVIQLHLYYLETVWIYLLI